MENISPDIVTRAVQFVYTRTGQCQIANAGAILNNPVSKKSFQIILGMSERYPSSMTHSFNSRRLLESSFSPFD
ncbi:hypothetical protein NQ315_006721 [Exocentrus adspersus]|uniref:Uncharacterized protein n=1 Tax=Exocentrus adspersus TaxID=1586481 RepID=A0AAV8WD35_9CUCU|nr:hypothetical protein NQ315_006721 [Exocentrus adspersus]